MAWGNLKFQIECVLFDMSGLFCPFCGEEHTGSGKFCSGCGKDISDTIIEYKENRLPIKLNNGVSETQAQPEVKEKKYPSGSPLPKPGRAGKGSDIDDRRNASALDLFCFWCVWKSLF